METSFSMIEILRDFVDKVDMLEIDYMLTGSFAMAAYGEIRFTRDIDVVVKLSEWHVRSFVDLFAVDYYVSEPAIKRALADRSMFNIINPVHGGKIDCIVMKDRPFSRKSFERRWKATVSGINFWVTTKEDLIIAKLNWSRDSYSPTQIKDIVNLTSTEYDSVYVARWVKHLELDGIWARFDFL